MHCLCDICRQSEKVLETLKEITDEQDQINLLEIVRDWLKSRLHNSHAEENLLAVEDLLALRARVYQNPDFEISKAYKIDGNQYKCKNCNRTFTLYAGTEKPDYTYLVNHAKSCNKGGLE